MKTVEVYEILVREHEKMLFAFSLGIVRDPVLAEDVVQEAFILGYQNLDKLRNKELFGAWIRTIARNAALSMLREKDREIILDPDVIAGMNDVYNAIERQDGQTWADKTHAVEACFHLLTDEHRECCQMHYFKSLKVRQIAEKLRLNLSTVLKRLERARNALRKCIEKKISIEVTK